MNIVKAIVLASFLSLVLQVSASPAPAKDEHDFRVPPGHLPPPGKCRIWRPGTPPGRQSPVGDCRTLSRQVPPGAYLLGNERRWSHAELRDRRFRHDIFDDHRRSERHKDRRYIYREEIRDDKKNVVDARRDVREDRQELQKNRAELRKDRAELRKDIRDGASRKEIAQDRSEIREDRQKIVESRKELRQSEKNLQGARQELREDLRRR